MNNSPEQGGKHLRPGAADASSPVVGAEQAFQPVYRAQRAVRERLRSRTAIKKIAPRRFFLVYAPRRLVSLDPLRLRSGLLLSMVGGVMVV